MFKKSLGIEQLERKDLFAGVTHALMVPEAPAAVTDDAVGNPVSVEVSTQQISVAPGHRAGDVTGDGQFDQNDLVRLLQYGKYNTGQPATEEQGDFNGDGVFDRLDFVQILIESQYTPHQPPPLPGDANLDGKFNRYDVVQLLQEDKFGKDEPATWGQGDFDGDGDFDRIDLVTALQAGNYQADA